jgi:hypothetical protein
MVMVMVRILRERARGVTMRGRIDKILRMAIVSFGFYPGFSMYFSRGRDIRIASISNFELSPEMVT